MRDPGLEKAPFLWQSSVCEPGTNGTSVCLTARGQRNLGLQDPSSRPFSPHLWFQVLKIESRELFEYRNRFTYSLRRRPHTPALLYKENKQMLASAVRPFPSSRPKTGSPTCSMCLSQEQSSILWEGNPPVAMPPGPPVARPGSPTGRRVRTSGLRSACSQNPQYNMSARPGRDRGSRNLGD